MAGVSSALVPFIPPGFRDWNSRVSQLATVPAGASWAETDAASDPEVAIAGNQELPWIETFAEDVLPSVGETYFGTPAAETPELEPDSLGGADDNWMLGEAGKRLDELTQSLSSLDATRAAESGQRRGDVASEEEIAPSELPMWGRDDEWMDIMPAQAIQADAPLAVPFEAPSAHAEHERYSDGVSQRALENAAAEAIEAQIRHADMAARALEVIARRVRAGEVAVPEFDAELGEAAVLAGILASLLRSGR
jgi:hypothetical protein